MSPSQSPRAPVQPNVIRRISSLKQLLKRWRNTTTTSSTIPPDVPSGHIAVYVGAGFKRFIVRAKYLNHTQFMNLLAQAEEEFGFVNQGPLHIPCDESTFEEVLRSVSRSESSIRGSSNSEFLGRRCYGGVDLFSDSRSLVHDKSVY